MAWDLGRGDAVTTADRDRGPRETHFVDAVNATLHFQRLLLLAET